MSRSIDITKQLGLRGLITRGGERWKTDEIKALQLDIGKLNKQFFRLANMNEMSKDVRMNHCILALFHLHGPILWPDPDPSKEDDRVWLYKAPCNDAPGYPLDLIFTLHKEIIEPIFIRLLITKCSIYKGNRDENGVCLNSARYRAGRVPGTTRCNRQQRSYSMCSDLTEYYTGDEDEANSVLGEIDGDHVGGADNDDFDPDTYHVATRSKTVASHVPSTNAGGDRQGQGQPTLVVVLKLPSDKLRAIAAGTFRLPSIDVVPSSASDPATSISISGRKRQHGTGFEQRNSPHKRSCPPAVARTSKPAPKPSGATRKYLPGGSGGGGRYVEVSLRDGTDEDHSTSASATAGTTDCIATDSRSESSLLAQDLLQADHTAIASDKTTISEAGASSRLDSVQSVRTGSGHQTKPHTHVDQPLSQVSTAGRYTPSQVLASEQRPPTGESAVQPGNMFTAFGQSTREDQRVNYSRFPDITAAHQFGESPLLSAMRRQNEDYKLVSPDDDELEITGMRKVEDRPTNFGIFTPNSSRRQSAARERNEPRQSVPKPRNSMSMPDRRQSTRVETPSSDGPQIPQTELQRRLSNTSLRIRNINDTSCFQKPAAFKHCISVDHIRQELEKYVGLCIGLGNMQQAETLFILLYQSDGAGKKLDGTSNKVVKRKYRIALHEEFDDSWEMIEDGLLELHTRDGEWFQLCVTVLMEGEE